MQAFADEFSNPQHHKKDVKPWHIVLEALHDNLKQISSEAYVALGIDIHPHLYRAVSFPSLSSTYGTPKYHHFVNGCSPICVLFVQK